MLEAEKALRDEACRQARNAMTWEKCKNCSFLVEVSTYASVTFQCRITGHELGLTDCISEGGG